MPPKRPGTGPPRGADALLAKQDWRALRRRLVAFIQSYRREISDDDAAEIAQQAIQRAWDPDYQGWDPEKWPELFFHLCNEARDVLKARERLRERRGEQLHGDIEELEEIGPSEESHEDLVARTQIAQMKLEGLRAHMMKAEKKDDECLRILEHVMKGRLDPTKLEGAGEALGYTPRQVEFAWRRMWRYLAKVDAEVDSDEVGRRAPKRGGRHG